MLARINKSYVPAYWDDFFNDDFLSGFRTKNYSRSLPSVNIIEEDGEYRIELAAPGLSRKDIKVELDNDVLKISYDHKENKEEKKNNYLKREFCHSSFERSFQLPDLIDSDNIKASQANGILSISLPKKKEVVTKVQKSIQIS
ncbi:MAG: Hsp20/alpha crystallin family protein [Bacteroidales bacterium]|nr:Hsp20/alpha crystallin family protein [Bacteroidales bacterium]MBN2699606.1 Hsp20/alpha crystallin family protein [Bacteroidales bacterium]